MTPMTFETRTARLLLRRPVEADRDFHTAVHSDPRLYTHAPHVLGTPETNAAFFEAILAHWAGHGFGYWVAEDLVTGTPLGWVGVRQNDGYLNLYYRFVAEAQRRGLARESGRAAVAMATEWGPDLPVRALVKDHNAASVRTAESVGLVRTGDRVVLHDDRPDEPASAVFEAPRVRRVDVPDPPGVPDAPVVGLRVELAALGHTSQGPAQADLAALERQLAAGDALSGRLLDPDGSLVGLGWRARTGASWLVDPSSDCLLVRPGRQGHGLESVLEAGLRRIVREDGGSADVRGAARPSGAAPEG